MAVGGGFGGVGDAAGEFTTHRKSLHHAQQHQQQSGRHADLLMGGQQPDQQARQPHDHDAQAQHQAAAQQIAQGAQHQAAQGAHQVAHGEHPEAGHGLQGRQLGGEKGLSQGAGDKAIHRKVVPLEGIAQQGRHGRQAPLTRRELQTGVQPHGGTVLRLPSRTALYIGERISTLAWAKAS